MKSVLGFIALIIILIAGLGYNRFFVKKQGVNIQNPFPTAAPTRITQENISPTSYPDTQQTIQSLLATKYNKPVSDVHVQVTKEVQGFAAGSVLFGQGGPGEGGMWLAVLGNGWNVVWDGNGNVDCNQMRQEYGFPDTILKPDFCI